ncbi:hypothetical protein HDU96_007217 [Phlyctochytrium bullatum]|nr:hypothetical protein HDU96_007217 [Phlyctochytrium bullatum]
MGIVQMELAVGASAVDSEQRRNDIDMVTARARECFERAIQADQMDIVGSASYFYMGQMSEGLEAIHYYETGIKKLEKEMQGSDPSDSEFQTKAAVQKIVSALCSMTEIYMTDCWYESFD